MSNAGVPMMELPSYKSHKVVKALSIAAIEIHEDKSATIAPSLAEFAPFRTRPGWADKFKGNEEDKGYYVVYEDDYDSWSPTEAFENGYTRLRTDDVAPCGMIYWADLAKQLANVWWKVSNVGGTLQHGDLDKEGTMFTVVLEQHGGKCFHGDTPMDAWGKAYEWLVSPLRPATSWTAQCDTLLTKLQAVIDSPSKRTYANHRAISDRLTSIGHSLDSMELSEIQP